MYRASPLTSSSGVKAVFAPNVYVAIAPSGEIVLVVHRSEMGTGIRTSLAMILADELDADWKTVKVVQAQGDAKYGDQNTDGSRSIRQFFQPLREAGGSARQMLVAAAAAQWRVSPASCRTEPGHVVHSASGRRLSYGALAEAVTINVTLLGGGFGRKSKPDYVAEAAFLAREVGAPVKPTWTREDDIRNDYFHAVCAQHMEGGLDAQGKTIAWLHRSVFPSIGSTFTPNVIYGSAGELGQGVTDMPYEIANVQCENGAAPAHTRIGWYRSVYNIPHGFALGSFVDELAAAARQDPVQHLLALLGSPRRVDLHAPGGDYPNYGASIDEYPIDTARYAAVVRAAAVRSNCPQRCPLAMGAGSLSTAAF
ncbi:molybdopterin cofactor-binding domain-containing protein [Paraburkholderia sp. GAS334]|jgi:CO/xanthine dehydrogenase Mo-binding subunit|uniref:molybdopterin cofactor-binding domain-containing protein n=1 Tax=Paraburkholderia sp. GAS334 TaxID=3035131 RepID=UPI003D262665